MFKAATIGRGRNYDHQVESTRVAPGECLTHRELEAQLLAREFVPSPTWSNHCRELQEELTRVKNEMERYRILWRQQRHQHQETAAALEVERERRKTAEFVSSYLLEQHSLAPPTIPHQHDSPTVAVIGRLFKELGEKINIAASALAPDEGMLTTRTTLGSGTFGVVTMEWCQQFNRGFAVKRPIGYGGVISLRREMNALLSIPPHANVITVESAWDTPRNVALALELATGDMHEALRKYEIHELMEMMVDVCQGVGHIHDQGMVHCDLKLENVLLKEVAPHRVIAKVSDFGFTHATGETRPRGMGTLGFLPPENKEQPTSAHPSQDVFSLGAMIITLMLRPDLVQSNMFAHQMLWTDEDRAAMEGLSDDEKETFLADLSFKKMVDTSDSGFGRTLLRPENLRHLPRSIQGQACKMMSRMVHPDPHERPGMGAIKIFVKRLAHATRWIAKTGRG